MANGLLLASTIDLSGKGPLGLLVTGHVQGSGCLALGFTL